MKKELYNEIEIPEGVEAEINENVIKIKGPEGEIEKKLKIRNLDFKIEGKKIIIGHKNSTKKEKKITNTLTAHIKNMFSGVQKKFEYKLKACFSHFPINLEKKENIVIVKNFIGENTPRKVKIPKGAEVSIDKQIITITSVNKEIAGQAAANFEHATKIRKKDKRVFQDGIFLINKAGKEI